MRRRMPSKHRDVVTVVDEYMLDRTRKSHALLKETSVPTGTLTPATHVLSQKIVLARVPFSRTTLWRMEREGRFPKRIKLSPNRVGWIEEEVEQWIQSRKDA